MDGVRVVELAAWVAGPAAGGILADWGADVVKVEPPAGDPFRGLAWFFGGDGDVNPPFELDNRSKRSIAVDFTKDAGREIIVDLVKDADVFISNLRLGALERAGFDYESLHALNPRLVYAAVTGYGMQGPDRDRPAYDVGAFWARSGVAASLTPDGEDPPIQRGGMGDHMTGMAAAMGISAALFHRERTGEGQLVSASLLRLGMYMMGWDANINLRMKTPTVPQTRSTVPNPLINVYATADGRRIWLLGLEGDRHFPNICEALGRTEWLTDERFAEIASRTEHASELVTLMSEVIGERPAAEWYEIFDAAGVWWSPFQQTHEALEDEQVRASGAVIEAPVAEGGTAEMVATPIDFYGTPWEPRDISPELGQHTELILMELGRDWDHIAELKEQGVIA